MKVYNLQCAHGHRFEGWFSSEDDSSQQLRQQAIACPMCDSRQVTKLPSAPRLNLAAQGSAGELQEVQKVQARLMDMLRKAVARTEDVGERFADEARRMHYEEIPERAIRGTASAEDCASLAEEGIDVVALPPALLPKKNLQ